MPLYSIPEMVPHTPVWEKGGGPVRILSACDKDGDGGILLTRDEARCFPALGVIGLVIYKRDGEEWKYDKVLKGFNEIKDYFKEVR